MENIGSRKHWQIQLFRLFGVETWANDLQLKYRYWTFHKFEVENFGDWPSIHQFINWPSICQLHQCILPLNFLLYGSSYAVFKQTEDLNRTGNWSNNPEDATLSMSILQIFWLFWAIHIKLFKLSTHASDT